MADEQEPTDITQQATTPTPTTAPRLKNPRRVAAGKAIAEKTRQAREQQKKALADAVVIIANNAAKKQDTPEPEPNVNADTHPEPVYGGLSTTQWLMVGGIVVGLLGLYYKREEIEAARAKLFNAQAPHVYTTAPEPSAAPAPNVCTTA